MPLVAIEALQAVAGMVTAVVTAISAVHTVIWAWGKVKLAFSGRG